MRLFVGISLSAPVRLELERVVARLKPALSGWRWSEPDSWHITLQFLGSTEANQFSRLIPQLRAIRSSKVPIQLGNLGVFDHSGVLYVDVPISPELTHLQHKVTTATEPCGFAAESRPYRPHMTLARTEARNRPQKPPDTSLAVPQFSSFVAGEFLLYESFLSPAGSRYGVRGRFPLG